MVENPAHMMGLSLVILGYKELFKNGNFRRIRHNADRTYSLFVVLCNPEVTAFVDVCAHYI